LRCIGRCFVWAKTLFDTYRGMVAKMPCGPAGKKLFRRGSLFANGAGTTNTGDKKQHFYEVENWEGETGNKSLSLKD